MAFLIGSVPPVECYVRPEFLYSDPSGKGPARGVWFGIGSFRGRAIECRVTLLDGAQMRSLPLHALMTVPGAAGRPLDECQCWDCSSKTFGIHEFPHLKGKRCGILLKTKEVLLGYYRYSIAWGDDDPNVDIPMWAEAPDTKDAHVIAGDDGNLYAQPNHRTVWYDPDLVFDALDLTKRPPYNLRNRQKRWMVESTERWRTREEDGHIYEFHDSDKGPGS